MRSKVNGYNRHVMRARLLAVAAFLWAPGVVWAQPAMAVEFYHLDGQGNVLAVTDWSGQVVESHDYDVFGQEVNPQAGTQAPQPKRFAGKERDTETGWDYFGARYYGSKIGRFTTTDPAYTWQENLVDPQRWNRYAYARNNPLRYVDPDGRAVWDTVGGWANAVGSNFFLGLGRTDPYHPDFAQGQAMGDKFSLGLSMAEMNVATGGGAVLALPSGGTVAIPAVALGAHSIGQAAAATYNLSKNSGDLGSIYKVPGSATTSGKPYVGRHNKPDPAKTRRSKDGRDRTQAEVIDNYDASNVQQGRVKEQAQIDKRGLGNLDNKRNEIRRD